MVYYGLRTRQHMYAHSRGQSYRKRSRRAHRKMLKSYNSRYSRRTRYEARWGRNFRSAAITQKAVSKLFWYNPETISTMKKVYTPYQGPFRTTKPSNLYRAGQTLTRPPPRLSHLPPGYHPSFPQRFVPGTQLYRPYRPSTWDPSGYIPNIDWSIQKPYEGTFRIPSFRHKPDEVMTPTTWGFISERKG